MIAGSHPRKSQAPRAWTSGWEPLNFLRSRFRLNAWQGAGIALSLVWALGAVYWTSKANEYAWAGAEETFLECRQPQPRSESFDACLEEMQDDYNANADHPPRWQPLVERAFIPVALGWLVVYGPIALYRRARRPRVARVKERSEI
ncbi:MAG TPA: hypothetical protein VNW15_00720 [Rhizomicrobium sp.]|jgi:hypothetical protein|nr:hypothetical protein [Rhizomicrobium sp.]